MFCENCGKEIPNDAKFCPECGAPIGDPAETEEFVMEEAVSDIPAPKEKKSRKKKESYAEKGNITGEKVTENIYLCPDGVYRWYYELDMLKNPTILFTVWKVLGIAFGIVALLFFIVDVFQGTIRSAADIWPAMDLFAILIPIFLVLSIIAYLIVAAMFGWKYIVLFEMDDERVSHIPTPKQFKKAQALDWLTVMVGILGKNRGAVSAGMLAGTKGASTSIFREVEFLRVRRKRHTIHVDMLLDKNLVYAEDADFDFVEQYIRERCVKAKIK